MANKLKINIKKWRQDSKLPKTSVKGDAGADCYINRFKEIISGEDGSNSLKELDVEEYVLEPLERVLCSLGFATSIPEGYYAAVVPRSGLALWKGISIANTPGTIDAGYRNEWAAIVINLSNKPVKLTREDRICQLIIRKLVPYEFKECEELPESTRGLGGFGSTGKN